MLSVSKNQFEKFFVAEIEFDSARYVIEDLLEESFGEEFSLQEKYYDRHELLEKDFYLEQDGRHEDKIEKIKKKFNTTSLKEVFCINLFGNKDVQLVVVDKYSEDKKLVDGDIRCLFLLKKEDFNFFELKRVEFFLRGEESIREINTKEVRITFLSDEDFISRLLKVIKKKTEIDFFDQEEDFCIELDDDGTHEICFDGYLNEEKEKKLNRLLKTKIEYDNCNKINFDDVFRFLFGEKAGFEYEYGNFLIMINEEDFKNSKGKRI